MSTSDVKQKYAYNYGPISGSQAIKTKFEQFENLKSNKEANKVPIKQYLRTIRGEGQNISSSGYPYKSQTLSVTHAMADIIFLKVVETLESQEQPFACAKGCDACCHFSQVNASGLEFEEIINCVENVMPPALKKILRDQINKDPDYQEHGYSACPFLVREDGRCGIFPIRPLPCRSFGSTLRCELEKGETTGIEIFQKAFGEVIQPMEVKPGHILTVHEEGRRGKNKANIHGLPGETVVLREIENDKLLELFK